MLSCHLPPSHRCCHGLSGGAPKLIRSGSHAETLCLCVPKTRAGMVPFLRRARRARPTMRAGLHPPPSARQRSGTPLAKAP
jgi:hypothetical protein